MNICSFIIITFFCIAGSTLASEAFKKDGSIHAEIKAYCKSPTEYENSKGGEKYGRIEEWNVSAVTSMERLFYGYEFGTCNPPISNWGVGSVYNFSNMFYRAAAFNQNLSGWDVANGRNFIGMFEDAVTFNQDLSKWDVAAGYKFNGMFEEAAAFNQELSGWDVRKGKDFTYMFKNSGMNQPIGDWNFKAMKNGVESLSVFFSMLGVSKCDDLSPDEREQFNNLVAFVNCAKK